MQLTFKFDSPGENKYNSWSKWYKYSIDGASQKLRGRVFHLGEANRWRHVRLQLIPQIVLGRTPF